MGTVSRPTPKKSGAGMTDSFGAQLTRERQPGIARDDLSKTFEEPAAPTVQDDAGETRKQMPRPTGTGLVAIQVGDPARALGTAVSYLMSKPAFARLPFGHWARVLIGQINRPHYLFVARGKTLVGFAGWAFTTRDKAESWIAGVSDPSIEDSKEGEIIVINAWEASTPDSVLFNDPFDVTLPDSYCDLRSILVGPIGCRVLGLVQSHQCL
jgi:hemolysin-activating ACP:hemolysin acyltransferase